MKHEVVMHVRRLAICGVLLLAASSVLAGTPESRPAARPLEQEAEITSVIRAFVQAWNKNQVDALIKLFTPGGSFKSPAGNGAEGRDAIRALLAIEHRDMFRQSTLAANTDRITYPKTDVAVAIGSYTLSNIPVMFGIEVAREGTFKFLLTRRQAGWLITSARISKG